MPNNKDIAKMLSVLSHNLTAEVEIHNAKNWQNEDVIRLYECLQNAIYETQQTLCADCEYSLSRPSINPSELLKD